MTFLMLCLYHELPSLKIWNIAIAMSKLKTLTGKSVNVSQMKIKYLHVTIKLSVSAIFDIRIV